MSAGGGQGQHPQQKGYQNNDSILVLLSTYNGACYVQEQLKSLVAQENVRVYCLIRDDGSKDKTYELVKKFCSQHENFSCYQGENLGVIESFNDLIRRADVEKFAYIAFCDQDDVWEKEKLHEGIEKLKKCKYQNIPLVYCSNLKLVDKKLNYRGLMRKPGIHYTMYTALVQSCATGCTEIFNKAAIYEYRKGIDFRMEMHDYWMFLVGVFLGKVVYDDRAFIQYRQHAENVVGAKKKSIKGYIKNIADDKTGKRQAMMEDFLKVYEQELSGEAKKIIGYVTRYKKSLKDRIILLLNPRFHAYSYKVTLGFKCRVLIKKLY